MAGKMDARVAQCFGLLRTPQFEPLVKYLIAHREDTTDMLVMMNDEKLMRRYQGKIEFLIELINHIEKADELIKKYQR